MKSNIESLLQGDHPMQGKKVTWPRTQLKSHFDAVRELSFCAGGQYLASVSEDCMMKLWDVRQIRR